MMLKMLTGRFMEHLQMRWSHADRHKQGKERKTGMDLRLPFKPWRLRSGTAPWQTHTSVTVHVRHVHALLSAPDVHRSSVRACLDLCVGPLTPPHENLCSPVTSSSTGIMGEAVPPSQVPHPCTTSTDVLLVCAEMERTGGGSSSSEERT